MIESVTEAAAQPAAGHASQSLTAAIGRLWASGRLLVADVADLVAAEAHVALQMLTGMMVAAVSAAVLGVLALAGLLTALGLALIEHGFSGAVAAVVVAIVCALIAAWFGLRLRSLARRSLFVRSRQQLRG